MKRLFLVLLILTFLLSAAIPGSAGEVLSSVDTKTVASALEKSDWVVVDTRLNDAFNGWKLDGMRRGGHIPGAVDFSANWLGVESDSLEQDLKDALAVKGIAPDKHVVLYDANGRDAALVAGYLKKHGHDKLYRYDVNLWAADESLPMANYPNYQLIVPAVVVKDVIDGKRPETFEKAGKIIPVEASWGEEKTSYAKGHVPGTFHINTDRIEPPTATEPVMWTLADDETLKAFALEFGFRKGDTVIVTGAEPLAAFRVATVLRYIGVDDVRVLNGGNLAWTMAGYELETKRHDPVPVTDFGGIVPGNPGIIDTMEEVKAGLSSPDAFVLVDNRTWKEHIGETSGYSYHKKKGRVPGAVFGYAGTENAYGLEYFRNPDKTMRNADEFLALWEMQGIDTSRHLSFMCGSGWRVAEVFTYADIVGLKDIAIFSDGWIGWSNDESNPIVTGDPGK